MYSRRDEMSKFLVAVGGFSFRRRWWVVGA
jgi:hypothetical protein